MTYDRRRLAVATLAGAAMMAGNLVWFAPSASAATTASFLADGGVLSVTGDNLSNAIEISRDSAGTILVNGGGIAVAGGTPTVVNTQRIQVFGQGGADTVTLTETNGALPAAVLFGGAGNDLLTAGSGADQLFGQGDNDILLGRGGVDLMFGGTQDDVLTGGDGDDQAFGEAGNDRLVWAPGDDTDLNEGDAGTDTVEVNGGSGAETFSAAANGTRVRFDRVNPAPFSLDIGTSENLVVNTGGGADQFDGANGLAALIGLTVDGGAGDDGIRGGDGDDVLLGGAGNDLIDGQRGDDVAFLGAEDDTFQWDPGDGSDVVEGQAGADRLVFNGSGVNERVDVSANGSRVRFVRNIANVTMDLNDLETVRFNAFRGSDRVTVRDVSGTDVTKVVANLAAAAGSATPDGEADTVRVEGTNGDDVVLVTGSSAEQRVTGLNPQVDVLNSDNAPTDRVVVATLVGEDVVDASLLPASAGINIQGGANSDILLGGAGDDLVSGNAGDDVLVGGPGSDTLDGGDGDDILIGDGGDVLIDGRAASRRWLADHTRSVRGGTVIEAGGKRVTARVPTLR